MMLLDNVKFKVRGIMYKYQMTMTAANRAHYLQHVLVSLANNANLHEFKLVVGLEPLSSEVEQVCSDIGFMPAEIRKNPSVYGVRKNPYETLKHAFDSGAEFVLYLEDDVELSSDAVDLAMWYFDKSAEQGFADKYLCLNLYNHESLRNGDSAAVIASEKFSALGMGITKSQWERYFQPLWFTDPRGWDFCFADAISKGLKVLQPEISRSKHIGRFGGVHYRANMHDHLYVNNQMWNGKKQEYFLK